MPVRLLFILLLALPAWAQPARLAPSSVSPELAAVLHHAHDVLCERHVTLEDGRPVLWHTLIAKDETANTVVPETRALVGMPPALGKGGRASSFVVRYSGNFPAEARAAFSFAADIWGTHVSSDAPIVIDAQWQALGERTLGSAGTTLIYRNSPPNDAFLPLDNTWYPAALAEALAGRDLNDGEPDLRARFNSEFPNWFFGTGNVTPPSDYNFVTVVLHEIGHGLGFFDSFDVTSSGLGVYGFDSGDGLELPIVFDRFLEDADERDLLTFPNNSRALGTTLQSEAVFFDGLRLRGASGDAPVQLFAPSTFEPGSSIAHLDEEAFRAGTPNSLMTPQLARGETVYSPGAFTCAIFADIGWPLGADCALLLNSFLSTFAANVDGCTATLSFQTAVESIDRIVVERASGASGFSDVFAFESPTTSTPLVFTDTGLAPGSYTYRLRFVLLDGSSVRSTPTTVDAEFSEATLFDVQGDDVGVELVLGGCAVDRIVVERSYFGDPFVVAATLMPEAGQQTIGFEDENLTPGRYTYRLRVDTPFGASTFNVSEEVQVRLRSAFALRAPRPHPFANQTNVDVVVQTRQNVEARLYDATGRLVSIPFPRRQVDSGNQRVRIVIDGSRLGAGVYFLRVSGDDFETVQPLVHAGG
jgi:hypothetical protein